LVVWLAPAHHSFIDWQREEKEDGTAKGAMKDQGSSGPGEAGKQGKVLRTYGQKIAKIDPASEQAAVLNSDVLALIAGRKQG
jgi:hypothetical protein